VAQPPPWRSFFDSFDESVGRRLESAVERQSFADALVIGTRLYRRGRALSDRAMGAALHLWNMPTRGDVSRVADDVARVEQQLRDLVRLERQRARPTRARPTPRSPEKDEG